MPKDFSGQDLRGKSFAGKNLTGANFRNADVRGVTFKSATLEKADFRGAKFGIIEKSYLSFVWPVLWPVMLLFMVIVGYGFVTINLRVSHGHILLLTVVICFALFGLAYLRDNELKSRFVGGIGTFPFVVNSPLVAFTLNKTIFWKANLKGTNFSGTTLSDTFFTEACIENTNFQNTKDLGISSEYPENLPIRFKLLQGTILEQEKVKQLLVDGKGEEQDFSGLNLTGAYLVNLDLSGVNFLGAILTKRVVSRNLRWYFAKRRI